MNSQALHKNEGSKVLILGAYGLLGSGIAAHLSSQGIKVTGFGRNLQTAKRVLPEINWVIGDLRAYCRNEDWDIALEGITAVVNCSGALQDGPNDELEHIHHTMLEALATACLDRNIQLIQISAVGALVDASTNFLSSKARGDRAIRNSGVRYVIFRPGLILAPYAYGGTALLRMLAAFPMIQAISYPQAKIQTVSLSDVSQAVELALIGNVPDKFECDLVEKQTHNLQSVVIKLRKWLGFRTAKLNLTVPNMAAHAISKCADTLSWLGWNSPLRSTGVQVLREGVKGDPAQWNSLNLFEVSSLDQTLSKMRATTEDRLSARVSALFPFLVLILSLFWILSGIFAFVSIDVAADVLENIGWSQQLASISVAFWAMIDIALGSAILLRKFAKVACIGMVITSIFYLVASSIFVPELWLDPLGPLVKVLPAILLALVTSIALENR